MGKQFFGCGRLSEMKADDKYQFNYGCGPTKPNKNQSLPEVSYLRLENR